MPTCPWNANNLACVNTSGVLNGLEEIRSKFSAAKDIPMSDLRSMKKATDPARAAEAIARRMDVIFKAVLGAKYESGVKKAQALTKMRNLIVKGGKTVCDLSVVVDSQYRFMGEV